MPEEAGCSATPESFHEHLYSLSQTLDDLNEDFYLRGFTLCWASSPTRGLLSTLGASRGRIVVLDVLMISLVHFSGYRALGERMG